MTDDEQQRFLDDLLYMVGEVPVETIVAKIKATTGDDDSQIRRVMGYFAFIATCTGQSGDPLEPLARDRMVDVIVELGLPREKPPRRRKSARIGSAG
jgi:hypothetical protein